jgi:hypothetical protein
MMTSILLALAFDDLWRKLRRSEPTSPSNTQKELFLTRENNGQRISAKGWPVHSCNPANNQGAYSTPPKYLHRNPIR